MLSSSHDSQGVTHPAIEHMSVNGVQVPKCVLTLISAGSFEIDFMQKHGKYTTVRISIQDMEVLYNMMQELNNEHKLLAGK